MKYTAQQLSDLLGVKIGQSFSVEHWDETGSHAIVSCQIQNDGNIWQYWNKHYQCNMKQFEIEWLVQSLDMIEEDFGMIGIRKI